MEDGDDAGMNNVDKHARRIEECRSDTDELVVELDWNNESKNKTTASIKRWKRDNKC